MQELKGMIHIGRPSYSHEHTEDIRIVVKDEDSGCQVIDISVPLAAFSIALTAAMVSCTFQLNRSNKIGMIREHKTEQVPLPDFTGITTKRYKKAVAAALGPFEVDGWEGSKRDMGNHHRHIKKDDKDFAVVLFERWVAKARSL